MNREIFTDPNFADKLIKNLETNLEILKETVGAKYISGPVFKQLEQLLSNGRNNFLTIFEKKALANVLLSRGDLEESFFKNLNTWEKIFGEITIKFKGRGHRWFFPRLSELLLDDRFFQDPNFMDTIEKRLVRLDKLLESIKGEDYYLLRKNLSVFSSHNRVGNIFENSFPSYLGANELDIVKKYSWFNLLDDTMLKKLEVASPEERFNFFWNFTTFYELARNFDSYHPEYNLNAVVDFKESEKLLALLRDPQTFKDPNFIERKFKMAMFGIDDDINFYEHFQSVSDRFRIGSWDYNGIHRGLETTAKDNNLVLGEVLSTSHRRRILPPSRTDGISLFYENFRLLSPDELKDLIRKFSEENGRDGDILQKWKKFLNDHHIGLPEKYNQRIVRLMKKGEISKEKTINQLMVDYERWLNEDAWKIETTILKPEDFMNPGITHNCLTWGNPYAYNDKTGLAFFASQRWLMTGVKAKKGSREFLVGLFTFTKTKMLIDGEWKDVLYVESIHLSEDMAWLADEMWNAVDRLRNRLGVNTVVLGMNDTPSYYVGEGYRANFNPMTIKKLFGMDIFEKLPTDDVQDYIQESYLFLYAGSITHEGVIEYNFFETTPEFIQRYPQANPGAEINANDHWVIGIAIKFNKQKIKY